MILLSEWRFTVSQMRRMHSTRREAKREIHLCASRSQSGHKCAECARQANLFAFGRLSSSASSRLRAVEMWRRSNDHRLKWPMRLQLRQAYKGSRRVKQNSGRHAIILRNHSLLFSFIYLMIHLDLLKSIIISPLIGLASKEMT